MIVLAFGTVTMQVWQYGNTNAARITRIERFQGERDRAVLERRAGDTWSYRVLPVYLVEGLLRLSREAGFEGSSSFIYIGFRLLQNMVVFALLFLYLRRLELSTYATLFGMTIFAWATSHSNYGSDLSFNTYFDVIFYLIAAIAVLSKRYGWIIPIMFLAALNRETSALIPVMVVGAWWLDKEHRADRKPLWIAALSLVIFCVLYVTLRKVIGQQPTSISSPAEMVSRNLLEPQPYFLMLMSFGLLPILALMGWRNWPPMVLMFGVVIVPIWMIIHLFLGAFTETRLFLVPYALVFIPGVLFGMPRIVSNSPYKKAV